MKRKNQWIIGSMLVVVGYVLGAAGVAFVLPKVTAPAITSATTATPTHQHVSEAEAEPLTGRFGTHGERHPVADPFSYPEAGLTERRRQTMRAMSGHFRAISATVLAEAGGDQQLQAHADALALMGGQIDALFALASPTPEGRPGALPRIWEEPDYFAEFTSAFRAETAQFAATVRDAGDVMNALHDLRYYCVACHANFRQR